MSFIFFTYFSNLLFENIFLVCTSFVYMVLSGFIEVILVDQVYFQEHPCILQLVKPYMQHYVAMPGLSNATLVVKLGQA